MKITFLGTNGWYDTATGNTPSVFIDTKDDYIILDAGFGFCKARELVKPGKPARLFLSHFHLDHIIGLHTLPLFRFSQGLDIYLAPGQKKLFLSFMKRPYTTPPARLPMKIRLHDLDDKTKRSLSMEYAPLRHSVPCYGFRFEREGKSATYCTDTGLCGNLKRLAKSADILMTECAMAPDDKGPNLFHITPGTAAAVAKSANVGELYLCHFDPGKYPSFAARADAEKAGRRIFSRTVAASDGMEARR